MIPVRLRLRNFLSYGDPGELLHFESFHIACLCGENGHGKSALLDAITWALWGSARGAGRRDVGDDDLIHHGQSEMEVEFEFDLAENRYLVLRKRSIRMAGRRKVGTTVLELQVADDGRYRPLSGDSVAETQRKINELLRIDYDTFINASFILQGRADEFMRKSPADRKTILGELLGLNLYDRLVDRARAEVRRVETELRAIDVGIQQIDDELKREAEYQAQLEDAIRQVTQLSHEVAALETQREELRRRKHALDAKADHLALLAERIRRNEQAIVLAEQRIATQRRAIADLQGVLARRDEIDQGMERLAAARREDEAMAARLGHFLTLNERRTQLEKAIAQVQHKLETERQLVVQKVAELRQQTVQLPRVQGDLEQAEKDLARLEQIATERDRLFEAIQRDTHQVDELRRSNERLTAEGRELRRRLDLVNTAGPTCPICESPLDQVRHRRLADRFRTELEQLREEYQSNQARVQEGTQRIEEAQQRLAALERELRRKSDLDRRFAVLKDAVARADTARAELADLESQASSLEERLRGGHFAVREHGELVAVNAELAKLGYDAAAHDRIRATIARLAGIEDQFRDLQQAERRLPEEQARLEELIRTRDERAQERDQDEQLAKILRGELAEREEIGRAIAGLDRQLDNLGEQLAAARTTQGRAQQLVDTCRYLRGERTKREAERARLADERSLYEDLVVAFGKKGIPAMIIETVIPEIEQEANDLLARMTDNRMHLTFETQREGSTGNVIETLIIRVADELGVRPLELYSGGESFRVNFAIRVALSKLLARRAGARLQTLVVDEGFGSQDNLGRQRLVEAINAIGDDFAKILVVTHLDDLKDAFPTRIDVVKGPEGSRITLS